VPTLNLPQASAQLAPIVATGNATGLSFNAPGGTALTDTYSSAGNQWYLGGNVNYTFNSGGTVTFSATGGQILASATKVTASVTSNSQIYGKLAVTPITTVGAGTLTAAAMVGGVITRSGSTATYTDTTDTATAIVGAISNAQVNTCFRLTVDNNVAYVDTIAAGTGVTLSGATAVAASTYRDYVGCITNVTTPTVTLYGIGSGPL